MCKHLGCLNAHTRQSKKHWRLKQASEDHCGTNTSALRSWITTHLNTQVLAVEQKECFKDAFIFCPRFKSGQPSAENTHTKFRKCSRCLWTKGNDLGRYWQKFPASLHHTKRNMTRNLQLRKSKKQIMRLSFSLKQIIKDVKVPAQISRGLGLTELKKNLIEQQIFSTKSWDRQNTRALSHETTFNMNC